MTERLSNPTRYDMPKPTRMLILDDLSRGNPEIASRIRELGALIDSPYKAIVTDVERLSARLKKRYDFEMRNRRSRPLDLVVAVGDAGEQVAKNLDFGTPQIKLNPTRRVKEDGLPIIVAKGDRTLEEELQASLSTLPTEFIQSVRTIGIVDDTIFFGETIRKMRDILAVAFRKTTLIALTLTYVPPFATALPKDIQVISGLILTSSSVQVKGVNSIDAKDFIAQDAIPLANGRSIPFIEEENWMSVWFGNNHVQAIEICQKLRCYTTKGICRKITS